MNAVKNFRLRKDHRDTTQQLAVLNTELAAKMIKLASETGQIEPLIEAVKSLTRTNALFTQATTPALHATIQKALGDTLLKVGRAEDNTEALDYAIIAYRGAITVASLLGEDALRRAAKKNCALAMNLRGLGNEDASAAFAA